MEKVTIVNSTPKKARYDDKLKPLPITGNNGFLSGGRGLWGVLRVIATAPLLFLYAEEATSKRQLIVKEIFETEFNYISQLSTINDVSTLSVFSLHTLLSALANMNVAQFCTQQ